MLCYTAKKNKEETSVKKYLKGFWVALLLAIVGIAGVQEPEAVQATVNGKGVVELNTEVRGTLVEGDVDI